MKPLFDTGLFVPDDDVHFSTMKGGAASVLGYQANRLQLAATKLRTRDVALDVGAHVGLITRQLLSVCPSVIAFEPSPANYECLVKNLPTPVEGCQVTAVGAALSDFNGYGHIRGGGANSGDTWIGFYSDKSKIVVHRFDDWSRDQPALAGRAISLVKIDVQGAEWGVLRGMEQTLREHKPVVIVECEKNMPSKRFGIIDDAAQLFLESLGAVQFGHISADYLYHWPEGT